MVNPSQPDVKGDSEVLHDGMNDAGHEAQLKKSEDSSSIKKEDRNEK